MGAVADRWRSAGACLGANERARLDAGQGQQFPVRHETVVGMGHHARPDLAKPCRGCEAYKLTGGHKPWTAVQIAAAKRD